ncbi:TPA: DUF551 domain-containing protein [Vibrio cholerae O1]
MPNWIPITNEVPEDGQSCRVLFEDKSESNATYWSELGVFSLTGILTSFGAQVVTHWMPLNDWCSSEEAKKLAAKKWQTERFDGVYIAVSNVEDDIPEQACMEAAIQAVQDERNVSVESLFLDLHNKLEGFEYSAENVEMFLKCQKEILSRAYDDAIPNSAFISCY